jgi:hypothetical protein
LCEVIVELAHRFAVPVPRLNQAFSRICDLPVMGCAVMLAAMMEEMLP